MPDLDELSRLTRVWRQPSFFKSTKDDFIPNIRDVPVARLFAEQAAGYVIADFYGPNAEVDAKAFQAIPTLIAQAREAKRLREALKLALDYVIERHGQGNPSCCTCEDKNPRGVCADMQQIRAALKVIDCNDARIVETM